MHKHGRGDHKATIDQGSSNASREKGQEVRGLAETTIACEKVTKSGLVMRSYVYIHI